MTPIQTRASPLVHSKQVDASAILDLIDKVAASIAPVFATATAHGTNSNSELALKLSTFEDLVLSIESSRHILDKTRSLETQLPESLQILGTIYQRIEHNLGLLKPYFEEYQALEDPDFASPATIRWITSGIEAKDAKEGIACFQCLIDSLTTAIRIHQEGLRFFKELHAHLPPVYNRFLDVGINLIYEEISPHLHGLQIAFNTTQKQLADVSRPLPSSSEITALYAESEDRWRRLSGGTLPALGLIHALSKKNPRTSFADMKWLYEGITTLLSDHVSPKFLSQLHKTLAEREAFEPADPVVASKEMLEANQEVQAVFAPLSTGVGLNYWMGWASQTTGTIYLRFKDQVFGCRFDRKEPLIINKKDFLDLAIHLLLDTMLGKATELEYQKALTALELLFIPGTKIPFFPIKSAQSEDILQLRKACATSSF
jgi:hypothetical protein